jgi:hypothetical protein
MSDEYTPRDFVYMGKRRGNKGPLGLIGLIKDDGTLEADPLAFDPKLLKGRMVGTVYTGASFSPTGARGLGNVKYTRRWLDKAAVMTWEASNDEYESELRSAKLEKDTAKVSEIEKAMLPLRKLYESYRGRGDWASKEALEMAVLRALKIAPRSGEQ